MKNWAPICVLFLVPLPAVAHKQKPQRPGSEGKDILQACTLTLDLNFYHPGKKVRNKLEAYNLGYCIGLVQGVYANTSGSYFCPPDEVQPRKVFELVVQFVKAHPELAGKDGADIVRWALSDEFPCEHPSKDAGTDTQGEL